MQGEAFEDERELRAVTHLDVGEDDLAFFGPGFADVDGVQGRFFFELGAIVVDAFGGVHVVLDFGKLADYELDHLHDGQDVGEDQTADGGVDVETGGDDQDAGGEDQHSADDIQTHGEPALVGKGQEVGAIHNISGFADRVGELLLKTVGSDRSYTGDGFAEAREDDTSHDRLVTLDLAG